MRISACGSHIDKEMIDKIIVRNGFRQLDMSQNIYGGSCPMCGYEKSFILWADKGVYRCFHCGCDGRFVVAPERIAEGQRAKRGKLAVMVV